MAVESFGDVYIVIGITHTEIRTKDLFTNFYFDGRKMTTFEVDLGLFCLLKVGQAKFKILIDCNVNICISQLASYSYTCRHRVGTGAPIIRCLSA